MNKKQISLLAYAIGGAFGTTTMWAKTVIVSPQKKAHSNEKLSKIKTESQSERAAFAAKFTARINGEKK